MHRLRLLLMLCLVVTGAAGCGSNGPETIDIGDDSGADAYLDTAPDDPGGGGDTAADIQRDEHSDTADVKDSVDVGDDGEDPDDVQDDVSDVQTGDTGGDIRDTVETDTTEPASMIPVFSGFAAAAGSSSSSSGNVIGFSMGAGYFEFSSASGGYILGQSMCVVE